MESVERALVTVQGFDPAGVAARDLRECLLIQLTLLDADSPVAMEIVTDHLRKLQIRKYKEIAKVLRRPLPEVLEAVEIIKHLDPRPGQKYNNVEARHIEPDVFIVKVGTQYTVVTNEDEVPQLRLSQTYRRLLEKGAATKEVRNYVKDRFKSAVQLLKNIEQRKNIIVKVCEAIIQRQTPYLDNGIDALKPMMIKEVAEEVGVHPSTVSRDQQRWNIADSGQAQGQTPDRERRSTQAFDRRENCYSFERRWHFGHSPQYHQVPRRPEDSQHAPAQGKTVK
jgi:RNA polymerase sigma-54 factor